MAYLAMSAENMYLTKSRVTLFEGMLTSKKYVQFQINHGIKAFEIETSDSYSILSADAEGTFILKWKDNKAEPQFVSMLPVTTS